MDPRDRQVLDDLSDYFVNNLTVSARLNAKFLSESLLTPCALEKVTNIRENAEKVQEIIRCVKMRGPDAMDKLLLALRETKHEFIADEVLRNRAPDLVLESAVRSPGPSERMLRRRPTTAEVASRGPQAQSVERMDERPLPRSHTTLPTAPVPQPSGLPPMQQSRQGTFLSHDETGLSLLSANSGYHSIPDSARSTTPWGEDVMQLADRLNRLEQNYHRDVANRLQRNEDEIALVKRGLADSRQQAKEYSRQLHACQGEVQRMKEQITQLEGDKQKLEEENKELKQQLEAASGQQDMTRRHRQAQEDIRELKKKQESTETEKEKVTAENRLLKMDKAALSRRVTQLQNKNASLSHVARMAAATKGKRN